MLGSQDSNSRLNSRLKIHQTQDSRLKLKTQTHDSRRIFSIIINQTKKRKEQSMDGVSRYDADTWRHSLRIKSYAQAAGNALVGNTHNLFGLSLKRWERLVRTSPTCVRETMESQVQEVFLSPKGGGNSSTTAIPTTTACSWPLNAGLSLFGVPCFCINSCMINVLLCALRLALAKKKDCTKHRN